MKKRNEVNNETVTRSAAYVAAFLEKNLHKDYCYHNYYHTFCVANVVSMLCEAMNVSKAETRIALIAAWFHDTGYALQMDDHETISASIAGEYLEQLSIDVSQIEMVKNCILATRYPQHPKNELERILCDADMFHLSEPNMPERSQLLRKEWEQTKQQVYSDKEWFELNLQFLTKHSFHTTVYSDLLKKGVLKNKLVFENRLSELKVQSDKMPPEVKTNHKEKKIKTEPVQRLERGVETLFRIASGNHMKLSAMADNKAHILLSINSIIISVVLSVLVKNLSTHTFLILPTILLLITCLVSIVFAIFTTRPKLSHGIFTAEQITNREANLLFFGNFHKMEWKDYEWGIKEIMYDKEYLYKSMTKDIYFLGKVLAIKYKHLNVGYKVFMYGLIGTVLSFTLCFFCR